MKITKRQLKRIIREEYARLSRKRLIAESAITFDVRANDPLALEIIDIAKDAELNGKPGITYKDIEYAFYEGAEPDEFVNNIDYDDIDFVTSMDDMDIEAMLYHMAERGILSLVSEPGQGARSGSVVFAANM